MPSGWMYCMCNDCGPIGAYPIEQRILRRVVPGPGFNLTPACPLLRRGGSEKQASGLGSR